ncbi:MAG: hypothetical protein HXO13_02155 [Prevotella salivae]|nr:hypothetical protein [Segatella salivae]
MNRGQEIDKAASEYTENNGFFESDFDDAKIGFIDGAQWADEHPSSSFIVKLWNLATKTAIAQINKEMPYFKSEKEIKEFINKKLKL